MITIYYCTFSSLVLLFVLCICSYHIGRPVAQDEGSREVPVGGGRGREADVPGGMPTSAPALLPLFIIGGWTAGGGGDGNLEEVSHSSGHQVEAILLKDVRIRQE